MLDPHFKAMLDELAKIQMPPLSMVPPEMVREGYRSTRVGLDPAAPRDLDVRDLTIDGAEGPLKARLYTPKDAGASGPGLVYFHGGGFVIGDLDTHDSFLRRLAAASGVRVLSVDYRLAPEHPFPAPHDDALAATRWAIEHAAEIGFDRKRIAVGGDSAGGNLAAYLALELKNEIAFQLLLYPATAMEQETPSRKDLAEGHILTREAMEWFGNHLAVQGHPEQHRAEPAYADVSGAPTALVVTAGFDPLKDEGKAYAEKLSAAGVTATHVEHRGFVHDFYILGHVNPKVFDVIDETAEALKKGLA
ncbi:MAG TPA: alpha/beta hydrolase [Caulobacteraceae bacterium]